MDKKIFLNKNFANLKRIITNYFIKKFVLIHFNSFEFSFQKHTAARR